MFTPGRVRVIALCVADVLCIGLVWFGCVWAYWLLGHGLQAMGVATSIGGYAPVEYLSVWPIALVYVFANALCGLYHGNWMYPSAPLSEVEELRRLFLTSFVTHVAVIAFLGFAYQTTDGFSRVVTIAAGFLTAILGQSFRNWMRRALYVLKIGQIPVVLAGSGATAHALARALDRNMYAGLRIVGYFDGTARARTGRVRRRREYGERDFAARGIPYLGPLQEIVRWAKARDIKTLMACQDERLFRAQLDELSGWFTYIEYLPTLRTFPVLGARAVVFDGIGGLEMVNQARMKVKRVQKVVLDRSLALLGFVLAAPLFVLLSLLVKLTSRGPVFYTQERLGRNGRKIYVRKFRSMYVDADARLKRLLASNPKAADEWRRSFKLRDDPRITLFGRFLRKTSLDELPQLFSVLNGEMALIGPRPIVAAEVAHYGDAYGIFSSVRPGITGLWQVSGRSETSYERRVALDTYYVLNWSPWMDIWILIRTIYAVLLMRGAR